MDCITQADTLGLVFLFLTVATVKDLVFSSSGKKSKHLGCRRGDKLMRNDKTTGDPLRALGGRRWLVCMYVCTVCVCVSLHSHLVFRCDFKFVSHED